MTNLLTLAHDYLTADEIYRALAMSQTPADLHARVEQDLSVRRAMRTMMEARDKYERALDETVNVPAVAAE